ncbi:hypothetical protein [Pleionea sediminis]|uniref:hypothetical protein n=1 Tax=Pleionea sediminis TaxID=2569479 RepID=UPI0011871579|nr:hypothetical protein [Pleionea sediminis]
MLKSASQGALASVVMFLFLGYARNGFKPSILDGFLAETIFISIFLWVIAFVLYLIVLSPIMEVFEKSSRKVSLTVFILVGLVLSMGLGYFVSIIPSRGEAASYQVGDIGEAFTTIVLFGITGITGAFFSWFSLKRDSDKLT